MVIYEKKKNWLMSIVLILFLLAIILIPYAVERTYAGRNENPDHMLTYTTGKLTWDSDTDVDEKTGVAKLSVFNSTYQNVESENGDKVIAPGTEAKDIVRLKNNANRAIQYIAVMYRIKEEENLPVMPTLIDDEAFTDTSTYPLPEGVTEQQVVKAVTGSVEAGEIQDFDMTWLWEYYENDRRDEQDTDLGNKAAWENADEVQAGLYIVVVEDLDPEDTNDDEIYTYPKVPQTGDFSSLGSCLTLMIISGFVFLLLMMEKRKKS